MIKAVIPVAGFGTRMLPASKSIPKEMITLLDKPLIQYVVEEAYAAGIRDVVFVTHSAKCSVENHFDTNFELEWQLEQKGKTQLLEAVRNTAPPSMRFSTVRQSKGLGLGHAVLCAKEVLGSDDVAILLPDVLIDMYECDLQKDNLASMLERFRLTGKSQIMVEKVGDSDIEKYGIADLGGKSPIGGNSVPVKAFVEKPPLEHAPSNLAVVGRYVLSKNIWRCLESTSAGSGGEIQLTDAIDSLLDSETVEAFYMTGKSHDCGNINGFIQTFLEYSLQNPKYGPLAKEAYKSLSN